MALDVEQALRVRREASGKHVLDLAADHRPRSGGRRQLRHAGEGDLRRRGHRGQEPERERLERIAGEKGDGFAVDLVAGGDAAAQVVVVHAGEIVVDEGVGVEALDGRRGVLGGGAVRAARPGPHRAEGGTDPLAAREQAVAHRGVEGRRARRGGRHEPVERRLRPGCQVLQVAFEFFRIHVPQPRPIPGWCNPILRRGRGSALRSSAPADARCLRRGGKRATLRGPSRKEPTS